MKREILNPARPLESTYYTPSLAQTTVSGQLMAREAISCFGITRYVVSKLLVLISPRSKYISGELLQLDGELPLGLPYPCMNPLYKQKCTLDFIFPQYYALPSLTTSDKQIERHKVSS